MGRLIGETKPGFEIGWMPGCTLALYGFTHCCPDSFGLGGHATEAHEITEIVLHLGS